MGSAAAEDKKTVAMHEAKIRELQSRITALLDIEQVALSPFSCVAVTQSLLFIRMFVLVWSSYRLLRRRWYLSMPPRKVSPTSEINSARRKESSTSSC